MWCSLFAGDIAANTYPVMLELLQPHHYRTGKAMASFIHYLSAAIIALIAADTARAQNPSAIRQNCQDDYETFCSGGEDDPVSLKAACLRQSYINLSDRCKRALQPAPPPDQEEQR